ncbi:acyl-CoA dehydrogenase (plasmid) [Pseudonocardia sp. EC080610-09]|uniref:acyl-CoA dehydrogenase family protein n=1 Tax=unclassified Pseudonocardia TaxID=2619320 RepID=UPI00070675A7|nr:MULTISPECIES: acyl-CoA dehydrogenase family protein [unclassified Pseudonocardia]ALL79443.1 acyl-CoA dehydrogenase [Pseudonocardia sp. EC080610-09]ALL85604.1 acyl-CoA dehydrogenase [Pseudonocardia sp. EC080619-01]
MTSTALPTDSARFTEVFARIADGALTREARRDLPHDEVRALAAAGFTALTVPRELGGSGASATELFALLVELAAADSNLPQLLRAHFLFVETVLQDPHYPDRDEWLRRVATGDVVGNASHERGAATTGSLATRLRHDGGRYRLDGEKYYSTGALFADWIVVTAQDEDDRFARVVLPTTAEGVELRDDWDGFGQRLTGSGATVFRDVTVDPAAVHVFTGTGTRTLHTAFLQNVLLASLAGVAQAAVRDATGFVRSRTRTYSQGAGATAATDPLVQAVLGRLSADVTTAEAVVLDVARAIDRARGPILAGLPDNDAIQAAELRAVQAQVTVTELVQRVTTRLFDVGGASATSLGRGLDRHWRNARTLSSHNPVVYQERAIGDHLLNGTELTYFWATGQATL